MGQCSGFSSLSGCCQCPVNNPQSIGVILNTADLSLYTARPSQEQALWRRQKLSCLEGAGGQAAALQRPPLPLPCRGLRRAPAPALPPLLGPRYRVKGTVARGYRISQPQVVMSSRGEEVCVVTMPQDLISTACLGCLIFLTILASCCSLQVYCGSAEAGRWVHVDVINGLVNK